MTPLISVLVLQFSPILLGQIPEAQSPVDRFLASIQARADVEPATRDFILRDWAKSPDQDQAAFLVASLSLLSEKFRLGMEAFEADDPAACAERMSGLTADADPFLAANAKFYLIKAEVQRKNFANALALITAAETDRRSSIEPYSYHLAEFDFLHAYCLVEDLQYEAASRHLVQFLTVHPDAPQRLTVSARQMLAELSRREPGKIGEVSDLMSFAANRLERRDAGGVVRERQQRAIDLLDQLIQEAEDREKNQSKDPKDGGSPNDRNRPQPQNPMQQSQLPPGAGSAAHLRVREASPGEAWGTLAPSERERILQALKETFPGKYRRLVEQYYEQLAKEP